MVPALLIPSVSEEWFVPTARGAYVGIPLRGSESEARPGDLFRFMDRIREIESESMPASSKTEKRSVSDW